MIQKSSFWLKLRMYILLIVFFGIVYALASVVSFALGIQSFLFYGVLAIGLLGIQYLIGPKMVEWSMRVKYVSEKEEPDLHKMVSELAKEAGLPKPRIGIAQVDFPNAFAFGRWKKDGRVCVTQGILKLLDKKELRAVLGHEMGHLRNKDMVILTLLSVIPMIAWYIAWSFIFSRGENRGGTVAVGLFAFLVYFITNLLVLYASRIREYYADETSVRLGNQAHDLASALYKLVYGSAKTPRGDLKAVEGVKAFFANDPSRAVSDLRKLSQVDLDGSGHLDASELEAIKNKPIKISGFDKIMEVMSTHPNMVKRIKVLSKLGK